MADQPIEIIIKPTDTDMPDAPPLASSAPPAPPAPPAPSVPLAPPHPPPPTQPTLSAAKLNDMQKDGVNTRPSAIDLSKVVPYDARDTGPVTPGTPRISNNDADTNSKTKRADYIDTNHTSDEMDSDYVEETKKYRETVKSDLGQSDQSDQSAQSIKSSRSTKSDVVKSSKKAIGGDVPERKHNHKHKKHKEHKGKKDELEWAETEEEYVEKQKNIPDIERILAERPDVAAKLRSTIPVADVDDEDAENTERISDDEGIVLPEDALDMEEVEKTDQEEIDRKHKHKHTHKHHTKSESESASASEEVTDSGQTHRDIKKTSKSPKSPKPLIGEVQKDKYGAGVNPDASNKRGSSKSPKTKEPESKYSEKSPATQSPKHSAKSPQKTVQPTQTPKTVPIVNVIDEPEPDVSDDTDSDKADTAPKDFSKSKHAERNTRQDSESESEAESDGTQTHHGKKRGTVENENRTKSKQKARSTSSSSSSSSSESSSSSSEESDRESRRPIKFKSEDELVQKSLLLNEIKMAREVIVSGPVPDFKFSVKRLQSINKYYQHQLNIYTGTQIVSALYLRSIKSVQSVNNKFDLGRLYGSSLKLSGAYSLSEAVEQNLPKLQRPLRHFGKIFARRFLGSGELSGPVAELVNGTLEIITRVSEANEEVERKKALEEIALANKNKFGMADFMKQNFMQQQPGSFFGTPATVQTSKTTANVQPQQQPPQQTKPISPGTLPTRVPIDQKDQTSQRSLAEAFATPISPPTTPPIAQPVAPANKPTTTDVPKKTGLPVFVPQEILSSDEDSDRPATPRPRSNTPIRSRTPAMPTAAAYKRPNSAESAEDVSVSVENSDSDDTENSDDGSDGDLGDVEVVTKD